MKRKLITIKCASDLTNRQLERLIHAALGVPANRITVTDLTRRKPPQRAKA
jgi:hypothetical protein